MNLFKLQHMPKSMKPLFRVLFWVYFGIASLALILVIIYMVRGFQNFKEERNFESGEQSFIRYFNSFPKTDSSFGGLFNHPSEQAIDYLNSAESYYGYSSLRSKPASISSQELRQLDSLMQYWPAKFRELHQKHILAIFIVDTARFNGLTQVIGKAGDRYIIYLNRALFSSKPNDWITRETTLCLQDEYRPHVKACLFPEGQNIPIKTVEHVLLHEYAHVFSYIHNEAPLPNQSFSNKQGYFPLIETGFSSGKIMYEWSQQGLGNLQILSSRPIDHIQKIDLTAFRQLNKSLVQSPFPTGYSTRSSDEMVAELFTQFIHQQYLGQQFYMTFNNRDTLFFGRLMDEGYMKRALE